MSTMTLTATQGPVTRTLPVHPRRAGWRAGAAAALVDSAVGGLRAGRSPHHDVRALAVLGGGDRPPGLVAAEELDRRLAAAVLHLADLHPQRGTAAAPPGTPAPAALAEDALADVVGSLFDGLRPGAVAGCPHPGERAASSVDVVPCAVPCAVHGHADGPVGCLRRSVGTHLAASLARAGLAGGTGGPTLGEQVRAASAAPPHERPDAHGADPVLTALWTGVAALAALRAHASTR